MWILDLEATNQLGDRPPAVAHPRAATAVTSSRVAAIEQDLYQDGFVHRYRHERDAEADGLPPGEGAFLTAGFWLVDNYLLRGDVNRARATFERLLV